MIFMMVSAFLTISIGGSSAEVTVKAHCGTFIHKNLDFARTNKFDNFEKRHGLTAEQVLAEQVADGNINNFLNEMVEYKPSSYFT